MFSETGYEETVMGLIVNVGQCKSCAFKALQEARKGNFSESAKQMAASEQAAKEAHALQTRLIEYDEGEGKVPVHLIMVHAQDHLMTAMLARELIQEMIALNFPAPR
ncbi:PTS lactose/cellobiose transporter subunit IIA [Citrobacter sedlakii]|uniref:PTS lactose/cellobiose transporter subunit IIA n=1 Tax=Citrobacter sedlakii TaxID=67826 RepID=UPI0005AA83E8|nr:PTS lactose/cellobiose transporter subunit IIA [Citrobacter sedlakii]